MTTWQCPICETQNTQDNCIVCGASKPMASVAPPPPPPPPAYTATVYPAHKADYGKSDAAYRTTVPPGGAPSKLKFGRGFTSVPTYTAYEEPEKVPYVYEEPKSGNGALIAISIIAAVVFVACVTIAICLK